MDECYGLVIPGWSITEKWVLADLHAIKYLQLNHQLWYLKLIFTGMPVRLVAFLNALVSAGNAHSALHSRRFHLLDIIKWILHLMLESAILKSHALEINPCDSTVIGNKYHILAASHGWKLKPLSMKDKSS